MNQFGSLETRFKKKRETRTEAIKRLSTPKYPWRASSGQDERKTKARPVTAPDALLNTETKLAVKQRAFSTLSAPARSSRPKAKTRFFQKPTVPDDVREGRARLRRVAFMFDAGVVDEAFVEEISELIIQDHGLTSRCDTPNNGKCDGYSSSDASSKGETLKI